MREQEADGLAIVCASAGFRQRRADIDGLDLVAVLLLLLVRDGVGDDQAPKTAVVEVGDGIAGEYAVCDDCVDLFGSVLHDCICGFNQCSLQEVKRQQWSVNYEGNFNFFSPEGTHASIGHIIHDNCYLIFDIPHEDHARDFIWA